MSSFEESVTDWITHLKAGDADSARQLWQRYFTSLVRIARQRLGQMPRRAFDEEDVALSAFDSFCRRAEEGGFPNLQNRHDLWNLLLVITMNKAVDRVRHERRQRRGGARVEAETDIFANQNLDQLLSHEPTPAFAAMVSEEFQSLLGQLDAGLREIAVWKMEGWTDQEISQRLGCARRTVVRKLRVIRGVWSDEGRLLSSQKSGT